jgi:DNA-binding phage protein
MPKAKISKKRSKSGTKSLKVHVPFKSKELADANLVIESLLECIKINDLDSFREVLAAHLMTVNKVKLAKKAGIGRRTIYDLIDLDREFNPELATISAIISSLAA